MFFLTTMRGRIYYKIIIPFLVLTLLVALIGSAMALLIITGSAQERLTNQLAQTARAANDSIVRQEAVNLTFLREMAFAGGNQRTGAPAVADALAAGNAAGLEQALEPYFRIAPQRAIRLDRLIVFDANQNSVLDWERDQQDPAQRIANDTQSLASLWFTPRILAGETDQRGDKYAGLLALNDAEAQYLFTAAPVVKNTRIVGGIIVIMKLDTLLDELQAQSQAAIVTVYRSDNGHAFASTLAPVAGLDTLQVRPELIPAIRTSDATVQQTFVDTIGVNERDYQMVYTPLRIRGDTIGLLSAALASDYVIGPWSNARLPLLVLTLAMVAAIIGVGMVVARRITQPINELVAVAQAVTEGNFERQSHVTSKDEIGMLSYSFDKMTTYLLDMYGAVRSEARERAAIIESISDGVIVCDTAQRILLANSATRALLHIADEQALPHTFAELPLTPIDTATQAFGQAYTSNLYTLHNRTVRVAAAPMSDDDGLPTGTVYVLEDISNVFAIDQAKTHFIATISHELRTPLTVLTSGLDMIAREMIGPVTESQRELLEVLRTRTASMTAMLNTTIAIAEIESGKLVLHTAPFRVAPFIEDVAAAYQQRCAEQGIAFQIDMPEDLPDAVGDRYHTNVVCQQLLDNALHHTEAGMVTLRVAFHGDALRFDVCDTGRGVSPSVREHLFSRFTRSTGLEEGINSDQRGFGLGLATARALIDRQGGAIWLERTSDQGSVFSFTLPYVAHAQEEQLAQATTAA